MSNPTTRLLPKNMSVILLFGDALAMAVAFLYTIEFPKWFPDFAGLIEYRASSIHVEARFYYYAFLCLLVITGCARRGHYNRRVPWWSQVQTMVKFAAFALIIDGFTYFTIQQPYSRFLIFGNWLLVTLLLVLCRQLSLLVISRMEGWKVPVVILGEMQTVRDCFYAFNADKSTGYEIQKVLLHHKPDEAVDMGFLPKDHPPVEIIEAQRGFDAFIRKNPGYFYIISMDGFRGERRDRLMDVLEDSRRDYAVIPSTQRLNLYGMEPHYFFGNDIMLLHKRNNLREPLSRLAKRLLDIGVAGMALPFLGLITLAVYAMKRIEGSKSPVFYGGMRVGFGGELFPCWKFCTMKANADEVLESVLEADPASREEWEKYKKLKNDPRVDSNISRLLRKTSLDELPQLCNVFTGEMSLVGPRPILPNQQEEYGKELQHYITGRPGLTGLWQVSGRNETSFRQRISWDSWYIRNWSLWHDIVILIKTVRVLITGSGAY